jgi:hypothetical protein
MKRTKLVAVAASILVLAGLAVGCAAPPIYNVTDSPTTARPNATAEDVKAAVIRAGAGLGWKMQDAGAGRLVGTLVVRTHEAVVDIEYSEKTYNIRYKNSVNLNYDGTAGTIHRNYNSWIQNLDRRIQRELAAP